MDYDKQPEKITKSKGFFSWVFHMDEEVKHELLNYGQYITLAFIFISILIFLIDKYIPKIDDTNSTLEIIISILLFIYVLFYIVYYINRIICYIPTFSGIEYPICNNYSYMYPIILSVLIAIISNSTNIKEGLFILYERLNESINNKDSFSNKKKKNKVQPKNDNQQISNQPAITNSLYSGNTTPINQLPVVQEGFNSQPQPSIQQIQQPQYNEMPEPMAANDFGPSFGTPFN